MHSAAAVSSSFFFFVILGWKCSQYTGTCRSSSQHYINRRKSATSLFFAFQFNARAKQNLLNSSKLAHCSHPTHQHKSPLTSFAWSWAVSQRHVFFTREFSKSNFLPCRSSRITRSYDGIEGKSGFGQDPP